MKRPVMRGVAIVVGALLLSGCGSVSDEELLEQARGVYFDYRAAVAEVQLAVYDGEWDVLSNYGDGPVGCGREGYLFRLGRVTPDGWRLPGTALDEAVRMEAWLADNGWENVRRYTYGEGIADVYVEASKTDAHVASLGLDIGPGKAFDSVVIRVETTCQPGNSHRLFELTRLYPDDDLWVKENLQKLPQSERPDARPSFGYTEDGKPRFWPEAP